MPWLVVLSLKVDGQRGSCAPGVPPVRTGPYRFLSHPNYAIVAAEIFVLPMAFGLTAIAVVFSVLNAAVLAVRIRVENAALRGT